MQVKYFLDKFPKEFIIISLQKAYNKTTPLQREYIIECIYYLFEKKLVNNGDQWFNIKEVKFSEIVENSRNVLLCADSYLVNRKNEKLSGEKWARMVEQYSTIGIWWKDFLINSNHLKSDNLRDRFTGKHRPLEQAQYIPTSDTDD